MDFDQEQAAPRAYVRGGQVRIKENGPARVTLEVTSSSTEGSKFIQTVSLSAGDAGNRVEFGTVDRLGHPVCQFEGRVPAERFEP